MTSDKVTLPKAARDVKLAEWEGFKRLAKRLPNHHVLAVELIRTSNDRTAAVFTIVKNHEPFQTVVMGDSHGRVNPNDCHPRVASPADAHVAAEARLVAADDIGEVSPDGMALGDPPIKQPPMPGVIALGGSLLSVAFDTGEHGPADSPK
jgi:hypothetical protein